MSTAPKMRNIGPKSAAWLRQVGLRTHEDIAAVGTVEAFMRVKRAGFKPTLNLLYAIEGALLDCHWQEISDERRQELILAAEAATALLPAPRNKPAAAPVHTTMHAQEREEEPSGFGGGYQRDGDGELDGPADEDAPGGRDEDDHRD
ncbi:TfoX/Sxy family protein [Lysobacter sp. CA199]|uniref:TfoX/Sxy family protein n=1 Tax=Lysobacter sp. CA199 TaxID=3455608 RepID=UPI003F8CF912